MSFGGFMQERGLVTKTFLIVKFFTPVICISRKGWNKIKKQCSCSKMPFYCLRANKTRDLFHNSRPLASLRLKNTLGGALVGGGRVLYTEPFVC